MFVEFLSRRDITQMGAGCWHSSAIVLSLKSLQKSKVHQQAYSSKFFYTVATDFPGKFGKMNKIKYITEIHT